MLLYITEIIMIATSLALSYQAWQFRKVRKNWEKCLSQLNVTIALHRQMVEDEMAQRINYSNMPITNPINIINRNMN